MRIGIALSQILFNKNLLVAVWHGYYGGTHRPKNMHAVAKLSVRRSSATICMTFAVAIALLMRWEWWRMGRESVLSMTEKI